MDAGTEYSVVAGDVDAQASLGTVAVLGLPEIRDGTSANTSTAMEIDATTDSAECAMHGRDSVRPVSSSNPAISSTSSTETERSAGALSTIAVVDAAVRDVVRPSECEAGGGNQASPAGGVTSRSTDFTTTDIGPLSTSATDEEGPRGTSAKEIGTRVGEATDSAEGERQSDVESSSSVPVEIPQKLAVEETPAIDGAMEVDPGDPLQVNKEDTVSKPLGGSSGMNVKAQRVEVTDSAEAERQPDGESSSSVPVEFQEVLATERTPAMEGMTNSDGTMEVDAEDPLVSEDNGEVSKNSHVSFGTSAHVGDPKGIEVAEFSSNEVERASDARTQDSSQSAPVNVDSTSEMPEAAVHGIPRENTSDLEELSKQNSPVEPSQSAGNASNEKSIGLEPDNDHDCLVLDDDPKSATEPETTTETSIGVGTDSPPPSLLGLPTAQGQAVLVDVNALLRSSVGNSFIGINPADSNLSVISSVKQAFVGQAPVVASPLLYFLPILPPARVLTDDADVFADRDYLLECPSFVVPYVYQNYGNILDVDVKNRLKIVDKWREAIGCTSESPAEEETDVEKALELLGEVEAFLKKKPDDKEKPPAATTDEPTHPYFGTAFGKFFVDIGANLVREFVVKDKFRSIKRRVERDGGLEMMPPVTANAVEVGVKALEELQKKNEGLQVKATFKCNKCAFRCDTDMALDWHKAAPHGEECSYCSYSARSRADLQLHARREHPGVLFRNEHPRAPHECAYCFFDEFSPKPKKSFLRHVERCKADYKPEKNLELISAWDAPGKLSPSASAKHEVLPQPCFHHLVNRADIEALFPDHGRGRPTGGAPTATVVQVKKNLPRHPGPMTIRSQGVPPLVTPRQQRPAILSRPTSSLNRPTQPAQVIQAPSPIVRSKVTHGCYNPMPKRPLGLPPVFFQQNQPNGPVKMIPYVNESCYVSCEICDAVIKDTPQLSSHMKWVHGVNLHKDMLDGKALLPLSCTECHYRFYTDTGLERHLLGSHGLVTPLMQDAAKRNSDGGRCPICGKMFQWNLLNHVSQDHRLPLQEVYVNLKCSVCPAMFVAYKAFEAHMYTSHLRRRVLVGRAPGQSKANLVVSAASEGPSTSTGQPSIPGSQLVITRSNELRTIFQKKPLPYKVMTGYTLFSSEVRKRVTEENPTAHFGEISRLVGAKWRVLSDTVKKVYDDRANKMNEESAAKHAHGTPQQQPEPSQKAKNVIEIDLSDEETDSDAAKKRSMFTLEDLLEEDGSSIKKMKFT